MHLFHLLPHFILVNFLSRKLFQIKFSICSFGKQSFDVKNVSSFFVFQSLAKISYLLVSKWIPIQILSIPWELEKWSVLKNFVVLESLFQKLPDKLIFVSMTFSNLLIAYLKLWKLSWLKIFENHFFFFTRLRFQIVKHLDCHFDMYFDLSPVKISIHKNSIEFIHCVDDVCINVNKVQKISLL